MRAYADVGDRTWTMTDFREESLESSRALYTPESLDARAPRPRTLEVYALVSGLSFAPAFTDALAAAQSEISAILGDKLHYWVAPTNLGVEYCVFKWPTDSWKPEWLPLVRRALEEVREPAFRFDIDGIQINPDGCAVARGFDQDATLFRIRERLKSTIPFLPSRQSGWAHVPLGRILEPLGADRFARLARLIAEMSVRAVATTTINSMKLIHETRWYMEEKTVVAEYRLGDA